MRKSTRRPGWVGLVVVFVSVGHVAGQVPFLGACPPVKTMASFDITKYLGKWYEAERYFAIFEFGGKCVTGNYTLADDGKVVISNRQTSALTGIESTIEGQVQTVRRTDAEDARLTVRFPSLPVALDAPYWILDTDYISYSVVWSCSNFGFFSTRNAWVLTRQREPSLETMERAYAVIDKNSISRAYFTRTDQKRNICSPHLHLLAHKCLSSAYLRLNQQMTSAADSSEDRQPPDTRL